MGRSKQQCHMYTDDPDALKLKVDLPTVTAATDSTLDQYCLHKPQLHVMQSSDEAVGA